MKKTTYHSNKAGEVLSLPNCSLTIQESLHFENIHKSVREFAKDKESYHLIDLILVNYNKGKRGAVGRKFKSNRQVSTSGINHSIYKRENNAWAKNK